MADIYEALAKRQNGTTVDYTKIDANQLSSLLARPTGSQRSEAQLRQAAENRFASLYNQKNLAAQQQYDTTANAISNQLAALADAYTAQREQTQKDTAASLSWADRNALQRGMGRSSYNLANMTNIRNAGDKALQATYTAETNERNALNNNLSLAKQQLGQLLAAYAVDRETDILAHMDELRDKDYTRALQELQYRNELEMALANFGLNASKSGSGGSGNGGNNDKNSLNANADASASPGPLTYQDFLMIMNNTSPRNNINPAPQQSIAPKKKNPGFRESGILHNVNMLR